MLLMSLIATLVVAQPGATQPASPGAAFAVLTQPGATGGVFDGRNWTCDEGGRCVGRGGGAEQPLSRECRRFVARIGPVSAYGRGGQSLSTEDLARCNAAAR